MQAYSDPKSADNAYALPDVDYFYLDAKTAKAVAEDEDNDSITAGWYWQACFPGCIPDSDPIGPFATEEECVADFTLESEDD